MERRKVFQISFDQSNLSARWYSNVRFLTCRLQNWKNCKVMCRPTIASFSSNPILKRGGRSWMVEWPSLNRSFVPELNILLGHSNRHFPSEFKRNEKYSASHPIPPLTAFVRTVATLANSRPSGKLSCETSDTLFLFVRLFVLNK